MNIHDKNYSKEDLDYLREMMNIAAGNAATALSQLLNCVVEIELPNVLILPVDKVSSIFKDPSLPVLCVKSEMVGDVKGALFFVVPDDQKQNMLKLIRQGVPHALKKMVKDSSVMEEIGNIIAGVFLTAIHDFSRLNIYHTVPSLAIDMVQSLLDESIALISGIVKKMLIIENEFIIKDGNVRTVLFVMPVVESIDILFESALNARKELGIE